LGLFLLQEIRSYKGRGLNEINSMIAHLGTEVINPKAEDKRLRSLELCFDYSLNRLSKIGIFIQ
jgi:hypothetical protein